MSIFNTNSDLYLSNVVFQNRNKDFGAFILRKGYTKNIIISLIIANSTFIVGVIVLFIYFKSTSNDIEMYKMIDYRTDEFSLKEVKTPRIQQKQEAKKAEIKKNEDAPPVVTEEQPKETIANDKNKEDQKEVEGAESNVKENSDEALKSVSSDTSGSSMYSNELFMKVEIPAEFPGGPMAFGKFIGEHIQYPEFAKKNKIDGIIYVHMIVNNNGTIEDLKIYKGIEESCNAEVIRIMKMSPNWIPARQKAKFVRQRMIIPIRFKSP